MAFYEWLLRDLIDIAVKSTEQDFRPNSSFSVQASPIHLEQPVTFKMYWHVTQYVPVFAFLDVSSSTIRFHG